MKTKQLFLPLFAAIAIAFVSCSSLDIVKRHYSDGYYVHVNKKKSVTAHEFASHQDVSTSEVSNQGETTASSTSSLESNANEINVNNTLTASSGSNPAIVINNNSENNFSSINYHGVASDAKAKRI